MGCSHYITPDEQVLHEALYAFLKQIEIDSEQMAEEGRRDIVRCNRQCAAILLVGLAIITLYLWWVI